MDTGLGPILFEPFVSYESERFAPDDLGRFAGVELPAELDRAVPRRRLEFRAGRHCAARALCRLDARLGEAPIPIGDRGAPVWPAGVVGAITHGHGFAAAAVARAGDAAGLGLDTERVVATDTAQEIAAQVASPQELQGLRGSGLDEATLLTVVFSAKESLFKCLFRLVGRYFDFRDAAVVRVSPVEHELTVQLQTPLGGLLAGQRLGGRFVIEGGLVHTGIALRRDDQGSYPGAGVLAAPVRGQ